MLTPEREKEIIELYRAGGYYQHVEAIYDLLTELYAVRDENRSLHERLFQSARMKRELSDALVSHNRPATNK